MFRLLRHLPKIRKPAGCLRAVRPLHAPPSCSLPSNSSEDSAVSRSVRTSAGDPLPVRVRPPAAASGRSAATCGLPCPFLARSLLVSSLHSPFCLPAPFLRTMQSVRLSVRRQHMRPLPGLFVCRCVPSYLRAAQFPERVGRRGPVRCGPIRRPDPPRRWRKFVAAPGSAGRRANRTDLCRGKYFHLRNVM